jgi:hypothetical protein
MSGFRYNPSFPPDRAVRIVRLNEGFHTVFINDVEFPEVLSLRVEIDAHARPALTLKFRPTSITMEEPGKDHA